MKTESRPTQKISTTFFSRSTGKPVTVTREEYTGPLRRGNQVVGKPITTTVRAINPTHM